jgi:hypothetical protein
MAGIGAEMIRLSIGPGDGGRPAVGLRPRLWGIDKE